jgi:hypothetical protein
MARRIRILEYDFFEYTTARERKRKKSGEVWNKLLSTASMRSANCLVIKEHRKSFLRLCSSMALARRRGKGSMQSIKPSFRK